MQKIRQILSIYGKGSIIKVNKKQYNNFINHSLQYDCKEMDSSLNIARIVFNNMGVALPRGTMQEVYDTVSTNEYMNWRKCTLEEAMETANNGTATMGISQDKIIILAAEDTEQPAPQTPSVLTLSDNIQLMSMDGLQYYSYSYGATTGGDDSSGATFNSDPFHYSNIEFMRIKKYDMSDYGGNSDITTIVTKSSLNGMEYFEAMALDRSNVAFVINASLKSQLNAQENTYQTYPVMFTTSFYFHLAKLAVDEMVTNGIISNQSAEYYGIWASEANRLLQAADKVSSQIQLTLAVVSAIYSIYNIVSGIKAAKQSVNSSQTVYATAYRVTADDVDDMFNQLSATNTKFNKENTMWIVRKADGQICWLESGNADSGFKHIMQRHPVSQFAAFNVSSELGVSSLICKTITESSPVGTYSPGGLVYSFGNQKYLNIVIGSNGYIVDAYNVSDKINKIVFF